LIVLYEAYFPGILRLCYPLSGSKAYSGVPSVLRHATGNQQLRPSRELRQELSAPKRKN
jgi:hypothetical protein